MVFIPSIASFATELMYALCSLLNMDFEVLLRLEKELMTLVILPPV